LYTRTKESIEKVCTSSGLMRYSSKEERVNDLLISCVASFLTVFFQNHLSVCQELEKQLQFTTGEKNKIQHALGAVKRQWEEHQTTCGGSHKV
jgi:hypothetical protein